MALRKKPATTNYRRIRRKGARTHLTGDDREGWDGVVVFAFARLCWVVLVGLSVVVRPGTAQELDLRRLPQGEFLKSLSIAFPPSPDAEEKQDPGPKSAQEGVQKGTSNDRILWTLPNFLTMENAKNVPPLTPRQKFKVTARRLFDPFEFVLIGIVAGIKQAANSNPSYGQGMAGYGNRYATAYGDNLIENFMSSGDGALTPLSACSSRAPIPVSGRPTALSL